MGRRGDGETRRRGDAEWGDADFSPCHRVTPSPRPLPPCPAYRVMMALTWLRLRSVTIPLRRYQTPSLVRQTSSASILAPLVSMMTGEPPCRFPMPGPLVETGSVVEREWEVTTPIGEGFTDGDGDGDGDGEGDGEGKVTSGASGAVGVTVLGVVSGAADVLCAYRSTA